MPGKNNISAEAFLVRQQPPHVFCQSFQYFFWFPLAYVIFGTVGVLTSVIAMVLSCVLPRRVGRPLGQRMIQRLFAFFVWYLEWAGMAQFRFNDLTTLNDWKGGIIVANHPCLMDIVFLVSRLPRVFCLMKGGIRSNLVLSGTAMLAGYVDNQSAKQTIEHCIARIRGGETLVIFPEGSRTIEPTVNAFKMGFALISKRSSCPIQTVLIKANSRFLGKHWPLLRPPDSFPLRYSLELGQRFHPGDENPKQLGRKVEGFYRDHLSPSSTKA